MYFFASVQYNMECDTGKTGPRLAGTGMESLIPGDSRNWSLAFGVLGYGGLFIFSTLDSHTFG